MKVSELIGAQLDYWVARANGAGTDTAKMKDGDDWCAIEMVPNAMKPFPACILGQKVGRGKLPYRSCWFYPSTTWVDGGPIIDRERMSFATMGTGPAGENGKAPIVAIPEESRHAMEGPTHLVAAMRAFVAGKFGLEVPDERAA
jgi:hypothetical protein